MRRSILLTMEMVLRSTKAACEGRLCLFAKQQLGEES